MSTAGLSLRDDILSAVGEIKGDIRGVKEHLGRFEHVQQKQWEKHDELKEAVSAAKGSLSTLKIIVPMMWALAMAVSGYMVHEVISLHDASITNTEVIENLKKGLVSPEGWEEVQKAALESQGVVRQLKKAMDVMQSDLDILKETSDKIVKKKAPAPINKTVIMPVPQPFHYDTLEPGKPSAGGPRR